MGNLVWKSAVKCIMGFVGFAALGSGYVHAGTMGSVQISTYPSGFLIGGELGYGYLSTQESNLAPQQFNLSPPIPGIIDIQSHHLGKFIWGAHAGYDIPILEKFLAGFEIGYKSLGKSTYSASEHYLGLDLYFNPVSINQTVTVTQQAIDLLVTSRLYVLNGLNIFGKAGAAYVRSNTANYINRKFDTISAGQENADEFDLAFSSSLTVWRIRPEIDIGVGYSFKNNLDFHVMYTYINGTDGNTNGGGRFYSANSPGQPQCTFTYNALTAGFSYYFG